MDAVTNKYGQCVITIDGTAASGKSSLAGALTKRYGALHLEYSLFFRLIAQHMLAQGFVPTPGRIVTAEEEAEAIRFAHDLTWDSIRSLRGTDLHTIEISRAAPFFSGIHAVLQSTDKVLITLIDASREKPIVVEGRTTGKYVYPNADVKLFTDADLAIRATRRASSLRRKGKDVMEDDVAKDLHFRDRQDQERTHQPAIYDKHVHQLMDTSNTSVRHMQEQAYRIAETLLPQLAPDKNKTLRRG